MCVCVCVCVCVSVCMCVSAQSNTMQISRTSRRQLLGGHTCMQMNTQAHTLYEWQ